MKAFKFSALMLAAMLMVSCSKGNDKADSVNPDTMEITEEVTEETVNMPASVSSASEIEDEMKANGWKMDANGNIVDAAGTIIKTYEEALKAYGEYYKDAISTYGAEYGLSATAINSLESAANSIIEAAASSASDALSNVEEFSDVDVDDVKEAATSAAKTYGKKAMKEISSSFGSEEEDDDDDW